MSNLEIITTVQLRNELGERILQAKHVGARALISHNGKFAAALVPVEDLELLLDGELFEKIQKNDDGIRVDAREFLEEINGGGDR